VGRKNAAAYLKTCSQKDKIKKIKKNQDQEDQ